MSRFNLHSVGQVGSDIWFEMYNGVHGNERSPADWDPEYFSIHPEEVHRSDCHYDVDAEENPPIIPKVKHTHRDDFDERIAARQKKAEDDSEHYWKTRMALEGEIARKKQYEKKIADAAANDSPSSEEIKAMDLRIKKEMERRKKLNAMNAIKHRIEK